MSRPAKQFQPRAVALIEEAVHLLRSHPLELAIYYAGAAPFAVGLLYAWARVTWFAPDSGAIAFGALGLVVLFGGMKVAQHEFARRLYAHCSKETIEPFAWKSVPALMAAEIRLQAVGVVVLPVAGIFAVPFGWLYAYFQSVSVVSGNDVSERRSEAWRQAMLWPAQNHIALTVLAGLWFTVLINVIAAFYFVPMLATKMLGLKTIFAIDGWSFFNTTLLLIVGVLTHLLVDPLIKAFYVLRVFHGRARSTGVDLRLVLKREKIAATAARVAMIALVFILGVPAVSGAEEAQPVTLTSTRPTNVDSLNRAIDETLNQPEFAWRLRPLPKPPERGKDGPVKSFVRATFDTATEILKTIVRSVRNAWNWVLDLFPSAENKSQNTELRTDRAARDLSWMTTLQTGAYVLLFVVLGVLLFVAWRVWRHNRGPAIPELAPAMAGTPDLEDETVEASRLPTDGWLELARQKMAAGEWRLALRALFLASLARLAGEGLVTLARFKTNHDYERELKRRARERVEVVDEFRYRRRQFEDTWYGNHPAEAERAKEWLRRLEGAAS